MAIAARESGAILTVRLCAFIGVEEVKPNNVSGHGNCACSISFGQPFAPSRLGFAYKVSQDLL